MICTLEGGLTKSFHPLGPMTGHQFTSIALTYEDVDELLRNLSPADVYEWLSHKSTRLIPARAVLQQ